MLRYYAYRQPADKNTVSGKCILVSVAAARKRAVVVFFFPSA